VETNRKITHGVLHHSMTKPSQGFTEKDILDWHLKPKPEGNGWKNPGYHYVILLDGTIKQILSLDKVANGALGWNKEGLHICYMGGINEDGDFENTMTDLQIVSARKLILLSIKYHPKILWMGHNQINKNKACPSFFAPGLLGTLGIPKENLDTHYYRYNKYFDENGVLRPNVRFRP
jgi:N-acetylmuramoyl-L-alanine amidase